MTSIRPPSRRNSDEQRKSGDTNTNAPGGTRLTPAGGSHFARHAARDAAPKRGRSQSAPPRIRKMQVSATQTEPAPPPQPSPHSVTGVVAQATWRALTPAPASLNMRHSRHQELRHADPIQYALTEIETTLRGGVTLRKRQQLFYRLRVFISQHSLPLTADSALLFTFAAVDSPQGRRDYLIALAAILRRLGIDQAPLRVMLHQLDQAGARVPTRQAAPVPLPVLYEYVACQIQALRPRRAAACLLAWKAFARWKEASHITRAHFILLTAVRIVVDWYTLPKGRKADPFVPSRWVVIEGPGTHLLYTLLSGLPKWCAGGPLDPTPTEVLDGQWRRDLPGYSAHSIKAGAETMWTQLTAAHLEAHGTPLLANEPWVFGRCTKHAHPADPARTQDIRYCRDGLAMALSLRTHEVTRLLPWHS
eukprot:TRINITY_DN10807_c0_g1_i2.p2 TRINITY_DN10807_c0_g1~~TRINITY_DN10807_c0_g1_i2.p2  ORF type:complete len:420 (-),score=29.50 TRINITY_DN10807_c0_g1_i2:1900-3159(-)